MPRTVMGSTSSFANKFKRIAQLSYPLPSISSPNLQFSQVTSSASDLSKSVAQKLKKINSNVRLFRKLTQKKKNRYELDPVEEARMQRYRKGFKLRAMDSDVEFDRIIRHGYGIWNNECDYTLKLSLTPRQIRSNVVY
ncbi:hypothetical protein CONCODRAFT_79763 [Conidiobolus coronatus NRRL 28638]|uniref:Uncharacterized protein n=1 Tax=Conidiobolus coronatus (strain ATCC 28846 / CBS 209.66 / NRRL 28638) TaxID=796925 RepID=A0A137NZX2_CONC2|nr:hypothetical protein CONCODRAFT_79763 [Conidiobolus coronatus NRRL 28638]|eukprot:KXN68355.1 hypothetical protein CONCODRAFT_79763 [Conidiobolus coronatus NRRL 28638]